MVKKTIKAFKNYLKIIKFTNKILSPCTMFLTKLPLY